MLEILQYGGVPVWFIMILGLFGLALSAYSAYKPTTGRIDACDGAQRAILYTTLAATAAGFSMMLTAAHIAASDGKFQDQPDLPRQIILQGASEALSMPIVGFAWLGIVALLTTVARMRVNVQ